MSGLRVTFYSYKGGVGRTLALLNVGALLAANGRKVVAVDLDLEAPGFGLAGLTRLSNAKPVLGVSDLLRDRLAGGRRDFRDHCYSILEQHCGSRFHILPAGTQPNWLAATIPELYRDPGGDTAELFLLLVDEIEAALAPDFILFDSRTGRADIAGVALLELPQVIVAVAGVNEQNVTGMQGVLSRLRTHPARREDVLTLLALSPIPTLPADEDRTPRARSLRELTYQRVEDAKAALLAPIQEEFQTRLQKHFPELAETDLLHIFPYDPIVPLTDELQVTHDSELSRAYGRLTDVLARARTGHPGLPHLWRDRPSGPLLS